uniref:Uncharacterized protein n=1 Tax=Hyaloperonospora arabidopsidis (strain Emoy2) TaxID=559515 RepID=M4C467_HYAAE
MWRMTTRNWIRLLFTQWEGNRPVVLTDITCHYPGLPLTNGIRSKEPHVGSAESSHKGNIGRYNCYGTRPDPGEETHCGSGYG